MVFNLFGLGKPDNDRSIDVILKEKMTPLRIDASHFCLEGQFTDDCYKRLVQKVKDVSKSFDDIDETVLQTQLSLANQAYERGAAKGELVLDHPLLQFVWGLALMRIVSNPEQMQKWPSENQSENGVVNSAIWEQLKATPFMQKKLSEVTVMLASRGFVHNDMYIRWGGSSYPQGVGYYFSPSENLVNLDLLWHLIGGSEHMVAVVFHELAHASGTVAFSPKGEQVREELMKKTNPETINEDVENLPENERIEKLTKRMQEAELLQLEAELRHMWFDEAENSFASGFCKVLTEKNLYHQDLAYDINVFETDIVAGWGFIKDRSEYKSLITPEMKKQEELQNQRLPMAEFLNFKKVMRYAFYVNNGLFENKRENWEKIGVHYDWLIGKDKKGRTIRGQEVIDDIIEVSAQIEAQQIPTNIYSKRSSIRTKIEEACQERGKLADESFERYIQPLLEKMLKERQQQQKQQQSQMQNQMQQAMKQMQQQSQMTPQQRRQQQSGQQSGQQQSQQGQQSEQQQSQQGQQSNQQSGSQVGNKKDEQTPKGQNENKENQSSQSGQGQDKKEDQNGQGGQGQDKKEDQNGQGGQGQDKKEDQNGQSGQGQDKKEDQNGQSGQGQDKKKDQNGQGGQGQDKKEDQNGQSGQGQDKKEDQNGQSGQGKKENNENSNKNNPVQKLFPRVCNSPSERRRTNQQVPDSDKGKNIQDVINQAGQEQQNSSAQEQALQDGVKELVLTNDLSNTPPPTYTRERHIYNQIISKHVSLLKKLKDLFGQLRNEYYSERDKVRRELLPEGSVQRSLDVRSVVNRVQKKYTRQEMTINDYRHFNNPLNPTLKKAPIDICIFIDTSGSVKSAGKADFAIELGCIINEAVKSNDAFNVYLGIMTNPVQYIVEPGMSEKEIADRLGSIYKNSYGGCDDDKIADATRETLKRIHSSTNPNEKEGFSHFFYITDGGHTDEEVCVPLLNQLMDESKITTFNWIKFSDYWSSYQTALDEIKKARASKIGTAAPMIVDIESKEDILPAFSKMLQVRIRDMKRSPALDQPVKKRMLQDSLAKIKEIRNRSW